MENLLKNIENLRERALDTSRRLDIDRKAARAAELKAKMGDPAVWADRERAVGIAREAEELTQEAGRWHALLQSIRDLEELVAEAEREGDTSMDEEAHRNFTELEKNYRELEFFVMFSGKYDDSNAIVSVHAGTGGVDAQDWAEMLERMFLRFAEKHKWPTILIDRTVGGEAGIKSSSFLVRGRYAYGYLKSENGVHRLVRISPFDAEAMRHTSFALVEVVPELPETAEIEVKEADLRIDVYRASGPGGQGVNTTDSAVRLVHQPTGIVVTCQNERSQHQNKETAMKILKAKLFQREEQEREKVELGLRGEAQKAEWGKQIRSYVLQPYQLVKDHRTGEETANVSGVLDGAIEPFIESYLRHKIT